jgi:beta-fructofuranosidase
MLEVNEGDPESGIFSGGAFINKEGIPHIVYKARGEGANLIAYSEDVDLKVWKKLKENPVLKIPEKNDPLFGKYSVGDPDGWYKDGFYYVLSGGSTADLFKSKDRINWQYRGKFIDQDNRMRFDFEDISCADFFKISEEQDKHMLLFMSHQLGMQYYIGDYKNERIEITAHGRMNWPGGTFIAPEQLKDNNGRNIFWGWVKDPRHQVRNDEDRKEIAAAWSGTMSMPRVVSLSGNGTLQIHPPEEVKALRMDERSDNNLTLQPGAQKLFADMAGKASSYLQT